MLRPLFCLAFATLLAIIGPAALAQVGGGTGGAGTNPVPAIDPDCGSIESNATADPTNTINCWISRNTTRATATYVYTENGQLKAKFRQYEFDGESYSSTSTRIVNDSVVVAEGAVIAVTLQSVASTKFPNLYKMVYTGNNNTNYDIGYLNFVRGNKGRPASKVSIKFINKTMGVKVTPNGGDPCDEPPIEDIGEEEVIQRSPTITNAPINFVAPIANCQN